MAESKGVGARKGREELILSWLIAQPEASRLSKLCLPPMFVCGKQPRPSLQIAHNGDNFIQTKKVSDHRERGRTCVAPGDEKTLLHRFRASEPEQRNDAAILKPPQCWHTALH